MGFWRKRRAPLNKSVMLGLVPSICTVKILEAGSILGTSPRMTKENYLNESASPLAPAPVRR
ncbi:hypothetical protein RU07_02480 [Agrobacterium tumefaciens]|uniref:Uncharacterized protein n=1 Tax=Agrobacterium tumefaciens TaxID=358 RepID=A0A0D0K8T3_AGRTU|nr:hypothetical protein RU07_02480 [Agrobacterium tumefaciens]